MSNRCRIDATSIPEEGEGETDSRVRSGGSVPNKPLTSLRLSCRSFKGQHDWGNRDAQENWRSERVSERISERVLGDL